MEQDEIAKFQNSYSRHWVSTVSTNASFGISVCGFRARINSFTRVILKPHDPCEVLARIWKPKIHLACCLGFIPCWNLNTQKRTNLLFSKLIVKGERNSITKNSFSKGTKEFQYTKMALAQKNRTNLTKTISIPNEIREGAKTLLHAKIWLLLQNLITKSQLKHVISRRIKSS